MQSPAVWLPAGSKVPAAALLTPHCPFVHVRVWQGVASGWLGKAAAEGGLGAMALGVVTHFGIATCMAASYALAAARVKLLYRRPALCGVAYGLLLYLVMYRVVLPLRFPAVFPRWDGIQSVTDIALHIAVALVIATLLSRWSARRTG